MIYVILIHEGGGREGRRNRRLDIYVILIHEGGGREGRSGAEGRRQ
jgi:hypothetical protein